MYAMADLRILVLEQLVATLQSAAGVTQEHTAGLVVQLETYKLEVTVYRTVSDGLLADLNGRHRTRQQEVMGAVTGLRDTLNVLSRDGKGRNKSLYEGKEFKAERFSGSDKDNLKGWQQKLKLHCESTSPGMMKIPNWAETQKTVITQKTYTN